MGYKKARERAGFSQAAAARKLGVSSGCVGQWEIGYTQPRAALLPRVAELYGCTVAELLAPDIEEGGEGDAEDERDA